MMQDIRAFSFLQISFHKNGTNPIRLLDEDRANAAPTKETFLSGARFALTDTFNEGDNETIVFASYVYGIPVTEEDYRFIGGALRRPILKIQYKRGIYTFYDRRSILEWAGHNGNLFDDVIVPVQQD